MNKFQKLAIGFTIIAATLASAVAAPSATRHTKLLSIKQRVMINTGESRTSASLVSPTAHSSNGGIVLLTNTFAAVPLPATEVAKFQAARIPRFNYEAFWIAMGQLQACENELAANADSYTYPYAYGGDSGSFMAYIYQQPPASAKTYADQIMAGSAGGIPVQYQSPTGTLGSCSNGGNPGAYAAASAVRSAVSNYSLDSPEVLDYVTSQYWIKAAGAANPLKAAVVQYLRENEIDFAWVDVEFEYTHNSAAPTNRRVAMSFQISRADEPTTRGSYLGSQVVLAPNVTPADSSMTLRANRIDVKYTAYSQYPDFTIRNSANATYLNQLMTDAGLNQNGLLSWNITQTPGSAISSRICSGVTTCTETTGQFRSTSGAYDPDFARAGFGTIPNAPYTLEHPGPIEDLSGIKCLVKGTGSTRCRLDKQNVVSLMQYANAIEGTLDYIGRWEVDFSGQLPGQTPTFEELGRAGIFDVCYGVEVQNTIQASYWVRRPRWKMNLYWQAGGVDYQFSQAPAYEFQSIARLPNPVTYTTYASPQNGYNLVGTEAAANVRSNGTPGTPTDSGAANNYVAVNLVAYDPQTFALPDREGAIMINPFVSSVSSTGVLFNGLPNNWMIYRPVGSLAAEDTVAARMRSAPSTPLYKAASLRDSNALPRGWLARAGNTSRVRRADFNCVDQNEPAIRDLIAEQAGVPGPTAQYNSPPPDPALPAGNRPYAGTVSGHKTGTRAGVNSPGAVGTGVTTDPCQLSYVPWSSVQSNFVRQGPLSDPAFVPPAVCGPSYNGPECIAPVNYYTTSVSVTRANDLSFLTASQRACEETCEIGGAINLCQRPYLRF